MIFDEDLLRYNPERDVCPVDQSGYIDLVVCFDEKVVPSNVTPGELSEEPCEDTDSCFAKPRDVFDLMQQHMTISENLEAKKSTE